MKKLFATIFLLISFPLSVYAVHVNGYYRSNGTYVNSYERTAPDGNPYNNYSYPGNYNPNTGSITGGSQDAYLNRYYNNSSVGSGYSGGGSYYSPSSAPSIPTCSGMATYDSVSSSCKCMSGYVIDSNGDCTSGTIVCYQKYGYGATFNYTDKTCSCSSGYRFDTNGQCVSQDSYCRNSYGYGAEYSSLKSNCVCSSGYVVDTTTNKCVLDMSSYGSTYTPSSAYAPSYVVPTSTTCPAGYVMSGSSCIDNSLNCMNQYGKSSYYDNGTCQCGSGYKLNYNHTKCVPVTESSCQDNATMINGSCSCSAGTISDGYNNCVLLSVYCQVTYNLGTSVDGLSCICPQGQVFSKSKNICYTEVVLPKTDTPIKMVKTTIKNIPKKIVSPYATTTRAATTTGSSKQSKSKSLFRSIFN